MDDETRLLEEMTDFINEKKIYLFLELRDYAERNNPEWAAALRNKSVVRHFIAYTNSKRKIDNVRKNCFSEYCSRRRKTGNKSW